MRNFLLTAVILTVALFPLNQSFAITGVNATQMESPIQGLSIEQIMDTPVSELDETLGRNLTRKEKSSARKIKKLNKRFQRAARGGEGADPMATTALATGAGGLLLMLLGPLFIIGFLSCIAAIVFGSISLKRFKTGTNRGGGRGMGLAGMICGIVGVALVILAVLAFAALFAV